LAAKNRGSGSNSEAPSYNGYSHATTILSLPKLMLLITKPACDVEDTLTVSGTAFAVSEHLIVTCSHNVMRGKIHYQQCVLVSKVWRYPSGDEFSDEQVPIKLINHDVEDDWAVFERTDGKVFSNHLQVETVLPTESTNLHFTIYHAPLNLL
jgi:hypothetical protein